MASQANQVAKSRPLKRCSEIWISRTYLCWVKQIHEGLGRTASVAVDDQMLASIEKQLGRAGISLRRA
jgi:hypothetical protein